MVLFVGSWLDSFLKDKIVFLDLTSEPEDKLSNLVEWLDGVAKVRVATFLNKKVNVVITNRENKPGKSYNSLLNHYPQKRSLKMLGMASAVKCGGSSSVLRIATKWNMTVLKYSDVLSAMEKFPFATKRSYLQTQSVEDGMILRCLRPAFVKVEDLSRKFRPEFVEMKSFPFIDFNTVGTGSPFGTWYNENCIKK